MATGVRMTVAGVIDENSSKATVEMNALRTCMVLLLFGIDLK
jgi:hypothetical protein